MSVARTPSAGKRLAAAMIHQVKSRLKRVGEWTSDFASTFFYSWGHAVASHPCKFILATFGVTALSLLGLLNFSSEADGWKIWLPEGTRDAFQCSSWFQGNSTWSIIKFATSIDCNG